MFITALNYLISKGCAPRPLLLKIPYCYEIPFKKSCLLLESLFKEILYNMFLTQDIILHKNEQVIPLRSSKTNEMNTFECCTPKL